MGVVEKYFSFTGASGCYAELPLDVLAGATTFTIEVKFSTTSIKKNTNNWLWGTIVGREIAYAWQDDFGLCVNDGKLCFWAEPKVKNSLAEGTGGVFSNAVVNDGNIHKVAVVSSNGAIDLYCDGELVAHTDNVNAKITDAQTILIAYNSDSDSLLQMDLYELRFWSVARTEIFATIDGTEEGLQGWYIPSADGLKDYSGNERHATLYGSPAYNEISELPVTLNFDVKRKVINPEKTWRYVNLGSADSLTVTGTTLNNLPESKSKTGNAFYQTTRAKCFDLSETPEVWLKFDVYFDSSNRWRAYNGGSNGTTGITAQTSGDLSFFSNDNNVQQPTGICKTNQLQTVLLHMISGSSAGVIEAWVDEQFIYRYTGDVNHGEDFADIYLQSDGAGTFFSNVIISNSEIKFGEGYQIFYFDVERRTSKHSEYFFDVTRCLVKPIVIPPIDDHFNHLFLSYVDIYSGGAQKFILPKKSKVYVRGEGSTAFRIFSDTDDTGKIVGSAYLYDGKFYAELDECEEVFIETTPILTPQQVIKAFMASLNRTTLSGTAAIDEAINFATGGKFQTASAVASQFMADLNSSTSYTDFLKDYCYIILGNDDTGAITGLDAGGYALKTRFSIVPEKTPVESWVTPAAGSTTTIHGLTVHWPARGASGRLTDAEKFILAGLNSEWIARSLELIRESYELDFNTREGAIVTDIDVNFENSSDLVLAYVNWKLNSSGKATKLSLYVNMRYYAMINTESEDGKSTSASFYLDRVISHEFVHAVMATNIDYMSEMPVYIREGAAELVHGIDDVRRSTIVSLLTSRKDDLENVFLTGGNSNDDNEYAAGFMFLRYLAKQGQHSDENSFTYNWWASTYPLLISDGATDSDYNALTDNTRQIFYPDVARNLVQAVEDTFDIFISNVIQVELFAAVKRALLSNVNLFTRDKENFFSDETNPFVNPTSTVPASSYSPPASADLPLNTQGLQNFEVALAEQQLTDQVRFSAVIPFDIMQQVKGQYLDYPYNMRVERVQQQGIIYSCDCCSDVDQLLYTQMAYKIPATTTWWKIDGEEVDGTPKTVEIETVYPAASAHVNLIANALHLTPVMQFDNFLSTVLMDEQGGVTYNDLIRDIFGWSSRVPTMLINVIIRDGKLFVIQRGHESHSVDISKAQMTVPVITKELVRTTWGSTPWSKTTTWESEFHSFVPADVVIGSSQPSQTDERVREVSSQFHGNGTQGYTTFTYDKAGRLIQTYTYVYDSNRGGQNTYTTVNNYYDNDGTMIATDTFTQSMDGTDGQSASRSRDEKHYITLPNGEKFLSQEVTKRYQNDSGLSITDKDLIDSRVTVHHPSRVGQSHVVTVSSDGEVVGEAGGQNTGDDRVTPFRNKKAYDFANSFDTATGEWKTQTQETGMTVHGLSLYDSSFPIHDEATLIKVTNALRNLNRKTKETVNVTLYDFQHLIDFDDKIILNGATYFLSSNTARTTPRIKFEQNLSLVRWY